MYNEEKISDLESRNQLTMNMTPVKNFARLLVLKSNETFQITALQAVLFRSPVL